MLNTHKINIITNLDSLDFLILKLCVKIHMIVLPGCEAFAVKMPTEVLRSSDAPHIGSFM